MVHIDMNEKKTCLSVIITGDESVLIVLKTIHKGRLGGWFGTADVDVASNPGHNIIPFAQFQSIKIMSGLLRSVSDTSHVGILYTYSRSLPLRSPIFWPGNELLIINIPQKVHVHV